MNTLRNFSMFTGEPGEDHNLLDFHISWDFPTESVIFQKMIFEKLEKLENAGKQLELE